MMRKSPTNLNTSTAGIFCYIISYYKGGGWVGVCVVFLPEEKANGHQIFGGGCWDPGDHRYLFFPFLFPSKLAPPWSIMMSCFVVVFFFNFRGRVYMSNVRGSMSNVRGSI